MPAARAEPSCITAHPAHDPHRLQGETYLWSIQMSPFSSRWVGGWWRWEQCSGAALGLRLCCITIGLTWESYSTISHPCTVCNAHPTLDYSMHQHATLHHTWPNLKTSSIVKVWNILIPLHHLTLRESCRVYVLKIKQTRLSYTKTYCRQKWPRCASSKLSWIGKPFDHLILVWL